MLQSSHLLDGSVNWNTNWARKFLKIPLDQLKRIDNISEWSTNQILTTDNTASIGVDVATEKELLLLQSVNVQEKLGQSNSSRNNIDNPKVRNSHQSIKNKVFNFSTVKNKLSKSTSLNSLNLFGNPSDYTKLRSLNSAPNLNELALSSNNLISVDHHTISITNLQKSKNSISSKSKFPPSEEIIRNNSISSKLKKMDLYSTSFSQPEMNCKSSKITKPLEKLADHVLNHKYLKRSVNSSSKQSDETEVSNVAIQGRIKHSINMDERFSLLEKRFSPSKEYCALPAKENVMQDSHLGTENQKLAKPISQTPEDGIPNTACNAGDELKECRGQKTSVIEKSVQEFEINTNKIDLYKSRCSQFVTPTNHAKNEEAATLTVSHEDSFGSQVIPCGQPLPIDVNSCSQPQISKKACIEMQDKSITESETAGSSGRNVSMQNSPYAVVQSSGTKRKRKSKSDTPKKIKNSKCVIHFTADQVINMLETMKMFHSEANLSQ